MNQEGGWGFTPSIGSSCAGSPSKPLHFHVTSKRTRRDSRPPGEPPNFVIHGMPFSH